MHEFIDRHAEYLICHCMTRQVHHESWVRPLVIILTVALAMFGAMIGLCVYDIPIDVVGQIGLVHPAQTGSHRTSLTLFPSVQD
jgi:hypothetical protein